MNRGSLPKRIPNNTRNYTHSNTTNVNPHSMGSLIKALEKKTEEIHISSEKIAENNREMELQRKIQNLEKEVLRLNRKLDEKDKQLNDYNKRVAILEKENQSLKRKQNYQPVEDDLAIALERINEMERRKEIKQNNTNIIPQFEVIPDELLQFAIPYEHPHEEIIDPVNEYEDHIINEMFPNPDQMTYEQLLELGENLGKVSRGLRAKELEKIPLVRYSTRTKTPQDCIICQDPFKVNEFIRKLTCGHFYHQRCVDEWLTNERTCPVCKKEVRIQ